MRRVLALLPLVAALAFVTGALASAPGLISVTVSSDRHPSARFSAPKASDVEIYFSSKPDRATDGSFFQENVVASDFMTTDEIQAGGWTYDQQLDPGTYYVMINADPDFSLCYDENTGGYDPSCANGYSNVVTLTVPVPEIRYRAKVSVLRFLKEVDLDLTASPLGTNEQYRVCYATRAKRKKCVVGTLDGFDWDSSASDYLSVSTRGLAAKTTFTWYVGTKIVAKKRVKTAHS